MAYRISAALGILALMLGTSFITAPQDAEAKRWDDYATVRMDGQRLIPVTVTVTAGTTVRCPCHGSQFNFDGSRNVKKA